MIISFLTASNFAYSLMKSDQLASKEKIHYNKKQNSILVNGEKD